MGSRKSKKEDGGAVTFSECTKHVAEALEELNSHVCELVGVLDTELGLEHQKEVAECRKGSGSQMPQLGVVVEDLDPENQKLPIPRVRWFVDSGIDESFRRDKVDEEEVIKPMSPDDGHYWRSSFEWALPNLAKWEIGLIWRFERRAQYLRTYVNRVERAVSELRDFDPLPSIQDLKSADDRGMPASFTQSGRV